MRRRCLKSTKVSKNRFVQKTLLTSCSLMLERGVAFENPESKVVFQRQTPRLKSKSSFLNSQKKKPSVSRTKNPIFLEVANLKQICQTIYFLHLYKSHLSQPRQNTTTSSVFNQKIQKVNS